MLWHSTANCKPSKFSSLFCIFLKNYWSSSKFDFCSCCGTLQPIANFPNFLHFFAFFSGTTHLILINLWFLFMLWHFAGNYKVSKVLHFLHFFSVITSFILINLWFLFMLWNFAGNCKFSTFSSLFCMFLRTYWSDLDQPFIFVHAVVLCSQLQSFSVFCIVLRNYWSDLDQNFDFCFCCGTLQPIVKFPNFLHFLHFLRNYWSDLDQTLIFVHAVALCSQL